MFKGYKFIPITTAKYIFLSSAHRTFSTSDHMMGHKTSLRFKKNEIIPHIFFNHNGEKLDINTRGKLGNLQIYGINTFLNNQWVKEKSKNYLKTNEHGTTIY